MVVTQEILTIFAKYCLSYPETWRFLWFTRYLIFSWISTTKTTCSTCAWPLFLSKNSRFSFILKMTSCTISSISLSNASVTNRIFRNFSKEAKKYKNLLLKVSNYWVKNWVLATDHVFYSWYSLHFWGLLAHDEAGIDANRQSDASLSWIDRWRSFPFPIHPPFWLGSIKEIRIRAFEHHLRRWYNPLQR